MSKDNRIIEQNLLDKVLAKAVQDYEKHGITHEVPEEERQKALEIMKEMGLKKIGEGDNSTDELTTTQSTDFFGK
jgi:predicted S18 family serine protease